MDYKELIKRLRVHKIKTDFGKFSPDICRKAADAIETLLSERDAAVEDLAKICEDNPDVCQYCKHMPCTEKHGRCIGWEWRGPQKGDGNGDLPEM